MNKEIFHTIKNNIPVIMESKRTMPINILNQKKYIGINSLNLYAQSVVYNKTPYFLTPMQVASLGGKIASMDNIFLNKEEIIKHFPEFNGKNVNKFRKEIFDLIGNDVIKSGTDAGILGKDYIEIKGTKYLEAFAVGTIKGLFISKNSGITEGDLKKLSEYTFEDLIEELRNKNVPFSIESEGIENTNDFVIKNIPSVKSYQVVSIDDIYGIDVKLLKGEIFDDRLFFNDSSVHSIIIEFIKHLTEKLYINDLLSPNSDLSDIEKFQTIINKLILLYIENDNCDIILNNLDESNKNLIIGLVTELLLYKLDIDINIDPNLYNNLLQSSPNVSNFYSQIFSLQSKSYQIASKILKECNIELFSNKIKEVSRQHQNKSELRNNLIKIAQNKFYDTIQFSSRGNLTIYDFNLVNSLCIKIGAPILFDSKITKMMANYNFFIEEKLNNKSLQLFLENLPLSEKKNVKNILVEFYYEVKSIAFTNKYSNVSINTNRLDKDDFYALLIQNNIDDVFHFLSNHLDENYLANIKNTLNDENKNSFKTSIVKMRDNLFSTIKRSNNIDFEVFLKQNEHGLQI